MTSLRSLQYEFSRDSYQRLLTVNNGEVDTDVLGIMWRDIMFRTETTPLSGKHRVTAYEKLDLSAFNAELALLQVLQQVFHFTVGQFHAFDAGGGGNTFHRCHMA